jgi:uncharacterized membrane protein
LECHGPDDAKNDFRVDDVDLLLDYIEPEDLESSTMFVDYLVSDDEDMLMPPLSHDGPLSAGELALIRVWIEEGANWPDGYSLEADTGDSPAPAPVKKPNAPETLGERVWVSQGFLHPATIHFPIAFFLLGAGFVVLGWQWPSVGTQIPLACLLLGSLTAVASTLMGWSFAPEQGYGGGWNPLDWGRDVDVHRWSGVVVTGLSVVVALTALIALAKGSESMTRCWKISLLILAGMVGAVGHQGGEMSYGKDFYPKAYRILMGTENEKPIVAAGELQGESDLSDDEKADLSEEEKVSDNADPAKGQGASESADDS